MNDEIFESQKDVISKMWVDLLVNEQEKIMQDIILQQAGYRLQVEKSRQFYNDHIKAYRQFIQLVTRLVKEIGLSGNSISYSLVITRLIHEGYLSDNLKFISESFQGKFFDIVGFLGIDVINGYCCCRHTSSIHQDIFHDLDLCGDQLFCIYKPSIIFDLGFYTKANHAVNLLEYNGIYYVHDIFNQTFYRFTDGFTMEKYLESDSLLDVLYYSLSSNMIYNDLSQLECFRKIKMFYDNSTKSPIDVYELIEILDETNNKYNKSNSILSDFRQEAKSYIKKIIPTNIKL